MSSTDGEQAGEVTYVKKGLLYKRRNGFGRMMPTAWHYRFFTLTSDGVLDYYDMGSNPLGLGSEDSKPRGRLALGYIQYTLVREPSIDGAPTPYAIQILPEGGGEKWSLCADAEADHHQWCLELEQFLHVNNSINSEKKIEKGGLVSYDEDGEELGTKGGEKGLATSGVQPTSTAAAPKVTKATVKPIKGQKAGGLKLGKIASPSIFSVSQLEALLTLTMANYCFALLYAYTVTESSLSDLASCFASTKTISGSGTLVGCVLKQPWNQKVLLAALYFLVGNYLVAKTLSLRGDRISKLEREKRALEIDLEDALQAAAVSIETGGSSMMTEEGKDTEAFTDRGDQPEPLLKDGKPIPGCTIEQVDTPQRLSPPHTWSRIDSSDFNVRAPFYSKQKKKEPSRPALYEPFAVDIFCSHQRIDHAAEKFALPEELTSIDTGHPDVPPVMVVQIQIPLEEPSLFNPVSDGPGWSIMMYLRITEKTLEELKDIKTASPAVKLWTRWCSEAMTVDDLRKRFKFIASCSNLTELGIPQSIRDYNAKPILIRRTGSLYRGKNNSYMEFDMHIHKFAGPAKKAIHFMTSKAGEMLMQIAFVIEGREDEELPEIIFGAIACNKPQEDMASFIFE